MKPIRADDEYSYVLHMQGHATTLPVDGENEAVRRLHEVVAEVGAMSVLSLPNPDVHRLKVYRCPECRSWHLSKKTNGFIGLVTLMPLIVEGGRSIA